jgi:anti-sigma regulatory factor (Ser/Thr protein kinase)
VVLWLENRVELEFPMEPQLFFLARMIGAAVATRAQFGHDQVEDLRLAVDELLVRLVSGREPGKTVHVDYEWGEDAIEVVASLYDATDESPRPEQKVIVEDLEVEELSESILGAVADQHGSPTADQVPISWLRMRRRGENGSHLHLV